jgi:predicted nucleic acid-binding protein
MDTNIIVYAMVANYPDRLHRTCLTLIEEGLKGESDYILSINPIIIVEVFSVLKETLDRNEAESRLSTLLRSKRIDFLPTSKEACQKAVQWAKKKNIPVNDALIAANAVEYSALIYTADKKHFKKLEEYGVRTINPTRT